MNQRQDRRAVVITGIEAMLFFVLTYFGRQALDRLLAAWGVPQWSFTLIHIAALLVILALALWLDRLLFAYLKKKWGI